MGDRFGHEGFDVPLVGAMIDEGGPDRRTAADAGYRDGYLFQPFTAPDPFIAALSGPRPATVRLLTLASPRGARLFRAGWKLPAGIHAADNY